MTAATSPRAHRLVSRAQWIVRRFVWMGAFIPLSCGPVTETVDGGVGSIAVTPLTATVSVGSQLPTLHGSPSEQVSRRPGRQPRPGTHASAPLQRSSSAHSSSRPTNSQVFDSSSHTSSVHSYSSTHGACVQRDAPSTQSSMPLQKQPSSH